MVSRDLSELHPAPMSTSAILAIPVADHGTAFAPSVIERQMLYHLCVYHHYFVTLVRMVLITVLGFKITPSVLQSWVSERMLGYEVLDRTGFP